MRSTPPDLQGVYEDDICPDCGEKISDILGDGDECSNCGHVFWAPEEK